MAEQNDYDCMGGLDQDGLFLCELDAVRRLPKNCLLPRKSSVYYGVIVSDFRPRETGDIGMYPRSIKNQVSPVLRIALLILGAAVFAWGLHYKLSLYNTSSHLDPTSVAKLIQGERPYKEAALSNLRNQKGTPLSLESIIPFSGVPVLSSRNLPIAKSVLPAISFVPSFLFFRPPPRANS